jgi:membrane associated rhomboid family serine protease
MPGLRPPAVILWLLLAIVLPEAILQAADFGLVGSARWRPLAYQNLAFWAGLLRDWRPNYALQPGTMFVTYSFLHGGLGHLLGNALALLALGPIITDRVGTRGFLVIWFVSVLGGALAFGVLTNSPQPMVGASGALFGLAGAWKAWDWQEARRSGGSLWPTLGWIVGLILLNFVLWVVQGGLLAWETHLGGFVAGWIWGLWLAPGPGAAPPQSASSAARNPSTGTS